MKQSNFLLQVLSNITEMEKSNYIKLPHLLDNTLSSSPFFLNMKSYLEAESPAGAVESSSNAKP